MLSFPILFKIDVNISLMRGERVNKINWIKILFNLLVSAREHSGVPVQACEVVLWPATHCCCKLLRRCVHMGEVTERKVHKIMSIFINIARINRVQRKSVLQLAIRASCS